MSDSLAQDRALWRAALSTLLGTREAINTIERELLIALAILEARALCEDNELIGVASIRTARLSGVHDGLWDGLMKAAVGVETNILTVLGQGAPDRASRLAELIEVSRDCLDDRIEVERDEFLLLAGESPSSGAAGPNDPAAPNAGGPQPLDLNVARRAIGLVRDQPRRLVLRGTQEP
jgi:hypothetical protein